MRVPSPSYFTNPIQGILKYPNHRIVIHREGKLLIMCVDENLIIPKNFTNLYDEIRIPYSEKKDENGWYFESAIWDFDGNKVKKKEKTYYYQLTLDCFNGIDAGDLPFVDGLYGLRPFNCFGFSE